MSRESEILFLEPQHSLEALDQSFSYGNSPNAFFEGISREQPTLYTNVIQAVPIDSLDRWVKSWHGRMFRLTAETIFKHPNLMGEENRISQQTWDFYKEKSTQAFALEWTTEIPFLIYRKLQPKPAFRYTVFQPIADSEPSLDPNLLSFVHILGECAPKLSDFLAEYQMTLLESPYLARDALRGTCDVLIPLYYQRAQNMGISL